MVRRGILHAFLFLAVLTVILSALDWGVTTGLRRSDLADYAEWNDILDGSASSDIIILGSSRAWVQFSPAIIGGRCQMSCYNLGIDGYTLDMQLARYAMYRRYNAKPRVVVQVLDSYSLNRRDDLYKNDQFLPYLSEPAVREAVDGYGLFKWYDYQVPFLRYRGNIETALQGLAELFGLDHYGNSKCRGYEGRDLEWSDEFERFQAQHPQGIEQKHQQWLVDRLDSFLAECNSDGIMVVLVYPPEYFKARDMLKNRSEIFAIYQSLAEEHHVPFMDFSYDGLAYDTRFFYNSQHLNKSGAELFSSRFADRLANAVAR